MRRPSLLLPTAEAAQAADLSGRVALVFDVLRATTTLGRAFEHGATEAWPAADVATALRRADELSHAGVLLCGEREGLRIPGFDLGNSPFEYTRDVVGGRPLAFASTNGSRALLALRGVSRGAIGSLRNAAAAARWVRSAPEGLALVCSGKLGGESAEDLAGAGAVLARLLGMGEELDLDAESRRALAVFREWEADLPAALRGCEHGAYLAGLGFEADLDFAGQADAQDLVPEWDPGRLLPGRRWPAS